MMNNETIQFIDSLEKAFLKRLFGKFNRWKFGIAIHANPVSWGFGAYKEVYEPISGYGLHLLCFEFYCTITHPLFQELPLDEYEDAFIRKDRITFKENGEEIEAMVIGKHDDTLLKVERYDGKGHKIIKSPNPPITK